MKTTPLPHTWSLSVEEQFYLLWPLAFVALAGRAGLRRLMVAVVVAVVVSVVCRVVMLVELGHAWAYYSTPSNVFALLMGCGVAIGLHSGWLCPWPSWAASVGLLGLLVVSTQPALGRAHLGWQDSLAAVPAAVFAAVVVMGALDGHRAFEWRPLQLLGVVSYGLYLWHSLAIIMLHDDRPVVRLLVAVPMALALTAISWRYVERPLMRRDRHMSGCSRPKFTPRPALHRPAQRPIESRR